MIDSLAPNFRYRDSELKGFGWHHKGWYHNVNLRGHNMTAVVDSVGHLTLAVNEHFGIWDSGYVAAVEAADQRIFIGDSIWQTHRDTGASAWHQWRYGYPWNICACVHITNLIHES